jgi:hypothetical protein
MIQLLGHVILDVLPQRARIRVAFQTARHLASVRLLQMSIKRDTKKNNSFHFYRSRSIPLFVNVTPH